MTVTEIMQAITNVGFPIACCIGCFWYITKSGQHHREDLDKMTEAINNNTIVMTKLIERLGKADEIEG